MATQGDKCSGRSEFVYLGSQEGFLGEAMTVVQDEQGLYSTQGDGGMFKPEQTACAKE